jgi:hypothetical protein
VAIVSAIRRGGQAVLLLDGLDEPGARDLSDE